MTKAIEDYFRFNRVTNKSECKAEGCNALLNNFHLGNCEKHLRRKHKDLYPVYLEKKKRMACLPPPAPDAKKLVQPSIDEAFLKPALVKMTKKMLLDKCLELVTVNGRPYTAMMDSGFRGIIDPIIDALPGDLTITDESMKKLVFERAQEIREKIKAEIKGKLVCLKIDGVKAQNRSFIGINVQYIDEKKAAIVIHTLATVEIDVRQSGENLRDVVIEILKKYDLEVEDVYTLTTDNGKNMVRVSKLLNNTKKMENVVLGSENFFIDLEIKEDDEESDEQSVEESNSEISAIVEFENYAQASNWCTGVKCMAHTLQLATEDALEMEGSIINAARSVVKKLRCPNMTGAINKAGLNRPLIDNSIRWMAKYFMLKRLLEFKNFCSSSGFDLSEVQWLEIENIVTALEHVAIATKILQKEQLTPTDAYFAWFTCETSLYVLHKDTNSKLALNIKEYMAERSLLMLNNECFAAALYLDPRFHATLQPKDVKAAKKHLTDLWRRLVRRKAKELNKVADENPTAGGSKDSENIESEEEEENPVDKALREKIMQKKISKEDEEVKIIKNILQSFSLEYQNPKDFNVIKFWIDQKRIYPELYEMALIVLSVPLTQVSVERLFSNVSFILNPLRNKLSKSLLDDTLLIRMYIKEGRKLDEEAKKLKEKKTILTAEKRKKLVEEKKKILDEKKKKSEAADVEDVEEVVQEEKKTLPAEKRKKVMEEKKKILNAKKKKTKVVEDIGSTESEDDL